MGREAWQLCFFDQVPTGGRSLQWPSFLIVLAVGVVTAGGLLTSRPTSFRDAVALHEVVDTIEHSAEALLLAVQSPHPAEGAASSITDFCDVRTAGQET